MRQNWFFDRLKEESDNILDKFNETYEQEDKYISNNTSNYEE